MIPCEVWAYLIWSIYLSAFHDCSLCCFHIEFHFQLFSWVRVSLFCVYLCVEQSECQQRVWKHGLSGTCGWIPEAGRTKVSVNQVLATLALYHRSLCIHTASNWSDCGCAGETDCQQRSNQINWLVDEVSRKPWGWVSLRMGPQQELAVEGRGKSQSILEETIGSGVSRCKTHICVHQ